MTWCLSSTATCAVARPAPTRSCNPESPPNRKLDALTAGDPELIATANIGCQVHLATATELPVVHWITLLDNAAIKT